MIDPRFSEYRTHGDRRLRSELIEEHLPLARAIARRLAGSSRDLEDLEQAAALGLVKAVDRFDPTRGTDFAAFAVPTITGEVKRFLRDTTWPVHVPRRLRDLDVTLRRAGNDLALELGRQPTLSELAAAVGADLDEVVSAVAARSSRNPIALERLVDDPAAVDRATAMLEDVDAIARVLTRLDDRGRLLLRLRFVEELSQRQIARRIGVSQVHVSRLLRRYVAALREELATSR